MRILMSFLLLICSSDYSVFAHDVGRPTNFLHQVVCQNIIDKGELVNDGKCLSRNLFRTDCTGKCDQEFLICGDDKTIRHVEDNQCLTFNGRHIAVTKCNPSVDRNQIWTAVEIRKDQAPDATWKIGGVSQKYYFFKRIGPVCMTKGKESFTITTGSCEYNSRTLFRFHNRGKTLKRAQLKYQGNLDCIAADGKLFSIFNEINII